jgi:tripartite ATP-independent transporter DctP family solute receptor
MSGGPAQPEPTRRRGRTAAVAGALIAVTTLLASCASAGTSGRVGAGSGAGQHFTIIYAGTQAPNNPIAQAQVTFANLIKKRSGGRITVDVHQSGDLGSDTTLLQQLQSGAIQMTNVGPAVLSDVYPAIAVLGTPFLFSSEDEALARVNGPAGQQISQGLEQKAGVRVLAWQQFGMVQLLSKRPVDDFAELKGLKIRVQPDKIQQQIYTSAGAQPTTADITEVYTLLQNGAVEAVPDPIPVAFAGKFQEVAKNLTMVDLLWQGSVVLVNQAFYDKLPADLQAMVKTAAHDAATDEVKAVQAAEDQELAQMKAQGVKVVTLPDAERQKWVRAVQPIYAEIQSQYGSLLASLRG